MSKPEEVEELSRVELSVVSALTTHLLNKAGDLKEKEDGWARLEEELNELKYGESRGHYDTVSDLEHIEIVEAYIGGSSMGSIARHKGRSKATIHSQIHGHNESVEKSGLCAICRRGGGQLYREKAQRV